MLKNKSELLIKPLTKNLKKNMKKIRYLMSINYNKIILKIKKKSNNNNHKKINK
jgi:hypothetical protein